MYLIVFLAAAAVALATTPLARWFALRTKVLDRPGGRKVHHSAMPLLGGLAVAVGFGAGCAVAYALPGARLPEFPLLGLAVGGFLMVALGIYDDWHGADARLKLSVQVLAALAVVASGSRIAILTNPFGGHWSLGVFSVPVTVLWIVGITNALNLIDGMDGLAAGIGAIVSFTLFALAVPDPTTFVPVVAIALAGASVGFLRYNFPPARIFLGDTGSLLLGFVISVIGIQGFLKGTTALALAVPILAIGVPVADTALAILRRSVRRAHLFKADREHLHHRLMRIGLTQRQSVLVLYWVSIFLALTSLSLRDLPPQKGCLLVVVVLMAGGLLLKALGYVEARFNRIYEKIVRLAQEGRAPGSEEMALLNGFYTQDLARTADASPVTWVVPEEEARGGAGLADLFGRPGTARRILEARVLKRPGHS